jgi:hypothetical protein
MSDTIQKADMAPPEVETEDFIKSHPNQCGAYFRSNVKGGIHTQRRYKTWQELFAFYDTLAERMALLDKTMKPEMAVEMLLKFSTDKETLPVIMHVLVLELIYWLESRGHLKSDDCNGIIWNWKVNQTYMTCNGFNPSDLRPLDKPSNAIVPEHTDPLPVNIGTTGIS